MHIVSLIPSFVQCCDLGYHASLHRALRTYLSAEFNVETSKHCGLEMIENSAENLEAQADKQRLMETYNNIFCPPMRFDFQSHMGDQVNLRTRANRVFENVTHIVVVCLVVEMCTPENEGVFGSRLEGVTALLVCV